ncbi:hypothetical protein S83_039397 [Arachis hypogaea]
MPTHITLVYHHGGRLERNSKGVTVYSRGQVSLIPRVNVDTLNLFFMEGLFKDLGYIQWKEFYWGKRDAGGGFALKLLRLDRDVVNMYEDAIKNDDRVVHVYWEHTVNIPTEVEVVDVDAEEVPTPETANVNAESVKSPGGRIKKRAQKSQKPARILRPRKLTITLGQKSSQNSLLSMKKTNPRERQQKTTQSEPAKQSHPQSKPKTMSSTAQVKPAYVAQAQHTPQVGQAQHTTPVA